jgi:hypothetical protein
MMSIQEGHMQLRSIVSKKIHSNSIYLIEEEETNEDSFSLFFFHQIFHRFTHSSKEVEKSPISKQNK